MPIEVLKFLIVGIGHNGAGYLLFVVLVAYGLDPVYVVAFLYPIGVVASFVLNKKWTFRHQGKNLPSFAKFIVVYLMGYFAQVWAVYVGVNILGYSAYLVQILVVGALAIFFFFTVKLFIFNNPQK